LATAFLFTGGFHPCYLPDRAGVVLTQVNAKLFATGTVLVYVRRGGWEQATTMVPTLNPLLITHCIQLYHVALGGRVVLRIDALRVFLVLILSLWCHRSYRQLWQVATVTTSPNAYMPQ